MQIVMQPVDLGNNPPQLFCIKCFQRFQASKIDNPKYVWEKWDETCPKCKFTWCVIRAPLPYTN